jgi:hypothetical protein
MVSGGTSWLRARVVMVARETHGSPGCKLDPSLDRHQPGSAQAALS